MAADRTLIKTDSTADRLIETIAAKGSMTVRELVAALGVTTTAVRQQVDRLTANGWLVRTRRPGRTGRPADVFAVSDKGNRVYAGLVDDFAAALVAEVAAGLGSAKANAIMRSVASRIADGLKGNIGEGDSPERLRNLIEVLTEKGVLAESRRTKQGPCVTLHRCPFGRLAEGREEICQMERAIFGAVVGETPELKKSRRDGARSCDFTFARSRAGQATKRPQYRS